MYGGGGLVGNMTGQDVIENCYNAGHIIGLGLPRGLVADRYYASSDVNNSYWDILTSGTTKSDGGTGYTTQEMQQMDNFTGWDSTSVWRTLKGKSYPGLRELNNAPMAFRDSNVINGNFDLSHLLTNDYDIENYQSSLLLKVSRIFGEGETDSLTWFSFPSHISDGHVDSLWCRVGELKTSSDTLWGILLSLGWNFVNKPYPTAILSN